MREFEGRGQRNYSMFYPQTPHTTRVLDWPLFFSHTCCCKKVIAGISKDLKRKFNYWACGNEDLRKLTLLVGPFDIVSEVICLCQGQRD